MTEFERAAKSLRCTILANLGDRRGVLNLDVDRDVLADIYDEMDKAIVALLTSHARPAAGFIRESTGPDRKVLGTLLLTKDGAVCGNMFCEIWSIHGRTGKVYKTTPYNAGVRGGYSTKEAAEAARLTPAAAQAERGEVGDGR